MKQLLSRWWSSNGWKSGRGERSVRKRERKEERSWREEGRVSAAERGRGVVVGRGGGEEEVWRLVRREV